MKRILLWVLCGFCISLSAMENEINLDSEDKEYDAVIAAFNEKLTTGAVSDTRIQLSDDAIMQLKTMALIAKGNSAKVKDENMISEQQNVVAQPQTLHSKDAASKEPEIVQSMQAEAIKKPKVIDNEIKKVKSKKSKRKKRKKQASAAQNFELQKIFTDAIKDQQQKLEEKKEMLNVIGEDIVTALTERFMINKMKMYGSIKRKLEKVLKIEENIRNQCISYNEMYHPAKPVVLPGKNGNFTYENFLGIINWIEEEKVIADLEIDILQNPVKLESLKKHNDLDA